MKHIIFGGDGFVGRYIARDLIARGDDVVVCDVHKSDLPIYSFARFIELDVRDGSQFDRITINPDDVVYNMAARLLMPPVKKRERHQAFFPIHVDGPRNILERMKQGGANRLVQFSTDMVYGPSLTPPPIRTDHPRNPIDAYGTSKMQCEDLCRDWRKMGMNISLFRPRMVMGPGRLGLLRNLFRLIDYGLPVPTIGKGNNRYQFVSVYDCASFAIQAADMGCPNGEWNLGSVNAPTIKTLLGNLARHAGSRSIIVGTPARLVKFVLSSLDALDIPLMTREQYAIADEDYVVDVEDLRATFGRVPEGSDQEMIIAAFDEYRSHRDDLMKLGSLFQTNKDWDAYVANQRTLSGT